MKPETFDIQILTPAFVGGADGGRGKAELRAPTIRGQARWWFRALGASRDQEMRVFGGVHCKPPIASRVKFRIDSDAVVQVEARPLPHSGGNKVPARKAVTAGTRFRLMVSDNPLLSADPHCFEKACLAIRAWILLGGMGFRANRGAGSVWPDAGPESIASLKQAIINLRSEAQHYDLWGNASRLGCAVIDLLNKPFDSAEAARVVCTDTINTSGGELGYVNGPQRQASPLKVKVIHLPGETPSWRILRIGFPFGRHSAHAGIDVLQQSSKPLGGAGTPLLT